MTMAKTAQQIANLELALKKWETEVEPGTVVRGLSAWKCGTLACFGGHLQTWPEFQAQGIKDGGYDGPLMYGVPETDIAAKLFGDRYVFAPRGGYESDDDHPDATDHEIVTHRLRYALAKGD